MTTQPVESIPTVWTETLDVPFFRLVWDLFARDFLDGATVLLASYDEDLPERPCDRQATRGAAHGQAPVQAAAEPAR